MELMWAPDRKAGASVAVGFGKIAEGGMLDHWVISVRSAQRMIEN